LSSVTDGDGNVTAIERNGTGQATGILSPFNQRTTLTLDGNGNLTRVTDPAGQVSQFAYTTQGLMTSKQDPRGIKAPTPTTRSAGLRATMTRPRVSILFRARIRA